MKPLSAAELAEALGVTPATVLTWARAGQIPHSRIGKRAFFVLEDVLAATRQPARPIVHLGRGRKRQEEDEFAGLRARLGRGDGRAVAGAGRRQKSTG